MAERVGEALLAVMVFGRHGGTQEEPIVVTGMSRLIALQ